MTSYYGDLILDGVAFRLAAPLRVTQLSTFPGKVTTGDYSKDSDPRLSSFVISDLSGGHGVADIREGVDQGRCRWATLNTSDPGQFAPPFAINQYTGPNTDGARPLGDLYESGTYRFYAAYGTALVKLNADGTAFGSSLGALAGTPVNKAVEFVGTGTRRLFIPCGSSGYSTYEPTGGLVNHLSPPARALCVWDNKLVALGTDGHLYRTVDGSVWSDWADDSDLAVVDGSYIPRNLVVYYDQASNPTIFVVTNRGALAFDPNGPRLYAVEALDWPPHPYQALGSTKWRSHLYVSIGMGTRRYTGEIAQPMGLDRDDGLPVAYRNRVLDMEPESNGLYQLCIGVEDTGNAIPHLQVWTDFGWHTVWADDTEQDITKVTWARVSEASGVHRVWWGDGTGNLAELELPTDDANPRAQIVAAQGSFSTSSKSILQTGRFDAGMAGIDKIASHIYVKIGGESTAGNLRVDYRRNGETNWTRLGTQSFANDNRSTNFVAFGDKLDHYDEAAGHYDHAGLVFQDIEFQVSMSSPGCWIEYIVFYYLKVLPPGRSFSAALDLSTGNFGQSPEDLADKLDALLNGTTFFEMHYRQTAPGSAVTGTDYIRARLTSVDGEDGTGEDTRALRNVTILEVPDQGPASSDIVAQAASMPTGEALLRSSGSDAAPTRILNVTVEDGWLMVAAVAHAAAESITAAPAGWTECSPPGDSSNAAVVLRTYYKVASGETGPYAWTLSGAAAWVVHIFILSGTATSSPLITGTESVGDGTSTTTVVLPEVTTATDNAQLMAWVAAAANLTWTGPDDLATQSGNAGTVSLDLFEAVLGTLGPSGAKTFTASASTANMVGQLLAFKAAGT
jgi:hypothetical protein